MSHLSLSDSREVLILIDGNNLVYRSFYAIPPLTNEKGLPTNAILGFANTLKKLLSDEKPALAAVAFDAGGKTFRHERYKAYKANRPPSPADLKQQMPYARKLCEALGLAVVERVGVEADDIIGTLAQRGVSAGHRVLIASADKDLLQLVNENVTVIHPVKYARIDSAGVLNKMGVLSSQIVDFLALKGDPVDNIPGVPGIGDKGAVKLINEWGNVEEILDRVEEIKNKRQRESLSENSELALLSKALVTIQCSLDLDTDLEELRYSGANRDAAFALFEELQFPTHLKDYFPSSTSKELITSFSFLNTKQELKDFVARSRKTNTLSLWFDLSDTPTTNPRTRRLLGVGVAIEQGEGGYADFAEEDILEALTDVLSDENVRKVGHDCKTTVAFLSTRGLKLKGRCFDTRVAAYVLNPSRRTQELSDIVVQFLQLPLSKSEDLVGDQKVLKGMERLNRDSLARLTAERAERMLRLAERMDSQLVREDLSKLFYEIEMPLVEVLADMELAGIAIDLDAFASMSFEIASEVEKLSKEIYEIAGVEFNINSPKQLGEVLFEKMNLPSFKKTQKQRIASTRVQVLEELAVSFPLPRKVLDYRSLAKLKGTYIDALPEMVNPETGRIHTTLNQTGTATGRLSSSDPNLQNIPIRTALGRRIRGAFVAQSENVLLSADYSQIELRVLAHLSKDENLIRAFCEGEDIHSRTAHEVFGQGTTLDKDECRRRAKIINFSIIYGKTAYTLGRDFGIPTREAQEFIDRYFHRYPKVREFLDQIIRDTRSSGAVRTLFGRVRYVPEIGSKNRQTRAAAERVAVNTPIQGTAADLIKKAMLDLARILQERKLSSRLLLQVHDELLLEVPKSEIEEIRELVCGIMEGVYPMDVPLKVDVHVDQSWKH